MDILSLFLILEVSILHIIVNPDVFHIIMYDPDPYPRLPDLETCQRLNCNRIQLPTSILIRIHDKARNLNSRNTKLDWKYIFRNSDTAMESSP